MRRLAAMAAAVMCLAGSLGGAPESEVEAAILHVVKDGVSKYNIRPFRYHRIVTNKKARNKLAVAITIASERYNIPRMLLVSIAFRENSFGSAKLGALGEKSAFQIVPRVARYIRKGMFPWSKISEPECSLDTTDGAALCAAAILAIHMERCGTIGGAMVLYASGRTCVPDNARLRWIKRDRTGMATYLEERF